MPRLFQDDANQHQLPSLIIRVMAMIYDVLIILAIWFLIGALGVILNQGEAVDSFLGQAALKSALLCSTFLFFGYSWTRSGQTIGMMAWRLRAQSEKGVSLTWTQALIRFFGAAISTVTLGAGYWATLLSDERLTWHERWSNTVTVRLPKPAKQS